MDTENEVVVENVDLINDETRLVEELKEEQVTAVQTANTENIMRSTRLYKIITVVFGVLTILCLVARWIAL